LWAFAQQHLVWELAASILIIVVTLAVLLVLPKRTTTTWCYVVALAAVVLDLGDQAMADFSLEPRQHIAVDERLLGGSRPSRLVDNRDFDFPPGTLNYSKSLAMVIAARVPSVVTNEGGVLPSSLSRLYTTFKERPSVALALSGCSDTCNRRGELWEPLPKSLPRFRIVPERCRNLVATSIEEFQPAQVSSLGEALIGEVTIVNEDSRRLELQVVAPERSLLVVADLFYPGWRCSVDDKATSVAAAHGVFRTVEFETGTHRVLFVYQPGSFHLGVWCLLAGLIVAARLAAGPRARRPWAASGGSSRFLYRF
jgi:hypothetical protein